MILDGTAETFQVRKTSSVSVTNPEMFVCYVDHDFTNGTVDADNVRVSLSAAGGTDQDVLAGAAGLKRQITYASILNRDSATHTITLVHDLSATNINFGRVTLAPNEWAEYDGKTWTVHSTDGTTKTTAVAQAVAPNYNSSFLVNVADGESAYSSLGTNQGSMLLFPLFPGQADMRFPGVMSVSSLWMAMSGSQTATTASSTSAQYTISIGLYSLRVSTLSLVNSGTMVFSIGSGSNCTSGLHGPRWLELATSGWSAAIQLTNDPYFVGIVMSSAGQSKSLSMLGHRIAVTNQWSGFLGSAVSSATSRGFVPFVGVVATGGIPTSVQMSEVNKANASAGFTPLIALNNFSTPL